MTLEACTSAAIEPRCRKITIEEKSGTSGAPGAYWSRTSREWIDPAGRVMRREVPNPAGTASYAYRYDARGQVVEAKEPAGPAWSRGRGRTTRAASSSARRTRKGIGPTTCATPRGR